MRITLKVDIEVKPSWYRSAFSLAGVPGRSEEAKKALREYLARAVWFKLNEDTGNWHAVKVEGQQKARRVLRANKVKGYEGGLYDGHRPTGGN